MKYILFIIKSKLVLYKFFSKGRYKNMGGGLMQLVAYGAQDIYLTGNPQITFFKVVYRRHTNFSMEAIEQTLNGTNSIGGRFTATISRNGDLVHRMYLETDTITRGGTNLCANPGSTLIKTAELEIGGQLIDRHYGHWMEVWAELTEPNPGGTEGTAHADTMTAATKFQQMAGYGGVIGSNVNPAKFFIPFQFWFCRNPGLALPLIALQYHEVKLTVEYCSSSDLNDDNTNSSLGNNKLFVDYIYLDTDERRRFAQVSHEYLIEQLQYQSFSGTPTTMDINFNHPVKELVWTGGTTAAGGNGSVNTSSSTPLVVGTGNFHLKLNGHDRMAPRDYRYFTRAQVWQHHGGYGSVSLDDSIAVYSFALKPEEHQPSGTCNFSRIDNAQLIATAPSAAYNIYAINYNVLRIMSGMGGLAYSN
jgi:hypothetical protein